MVWILVATLVLADGAAASWAERALTMPVRLTDWFYLALHYNDSLLLGRLSVERVKLLYSIIAGTGWISFVWYIATSKRNAVRISLALVLAGLIGNSSSMMMEAVPDYFGVGPVADDVWLFFNVSDVMIVVGSLSLVGVLVRARFGTEAVAAE